MLYLHTGFIPAEELILTNRNLKQKNIFMEVYIGTICAFGFNYAPYGFMFCQGQILPINGNTALFSLLGTAYGGNGTSTFGLPNLGGSVAIGQGNNGQSTYSMGETGGANSVSLTSGNLPAHAHSFTVVLNGNDRDTAGLSNSPAGNFPATATGANVGNYNDVASTGVFMKPPTVILGSTGGNMPVSIQDPILVVNYSIALQGIFPPRS
jgi:microcystin-dependent protein